MPVSSPELDPYVRSKMQALLANLQRQVSMYHVDGKVHMQGILRNGLGAKILIHNLEESCEDEIECWKLTAQQSGAVRADFIANFQRGDIVFDVEYKRPKTPCKYTEWLKYPVILTILTMALTSL